MKTLLAAAISDRSSNLYSLEQLPNSLSSQISTSQSSSALAEASPARLPFGRRSTDLVECPKCGKRSIVARAHNTFDCLNCNFHRELPPVTGSLASQARPLNSLMSSGLYRSPLELTDMEDKTESSQPLLFAAIAVIFGILLL